MLSHAKLRSFLMLKICNSSFFFVVFSQKPLDLFDLDRISDFFGNHDFTQGIHNDANPETLDPSHREKLPTGGIQAEASKDAPKGTPRRTAWGYD